MENIVKFKNFSYFLPWWSCWWCCRRGDWDRSDQGCVKESGVNATSVKYGIDCFINTPDDCKDSIDTLDVDGDKDDSRKDIKQYYK